MPCYAFGPFTLDSERRVLEENGNSVPISGKAFDVLLLLIDNRGRPLDKDELLSRVWAGSIVEESSLAHSISALRKALADRPKDPVYIATIAGRGYQFVAPVAEQIKQTESPQIAEQPSPLWSRISKKSWFLTAAVIAVLLAVSAWYVEKAGRKVAPEPRLTHFTTYPGSETMPAFSPDGKQIAYVRGQLEPLSWLEGQTGDANIYTKLIGAQTELRVTNHPSADEFPAWSPDGQFIAYYRQQPGLSGIYIVSALGGHERRITVEEGKLQGITWLPDGRRLLVSRLFEGSQSSPLIEVSVDTGMQRRFTSPPPVAGGDAWPAISNDRQKLAFVRSQGSDNLACFMNLSSNEAPACWRLDLTWPEGLAWAGTGNGIIVSGIRDEGWRLWRYENKGERPVALTSGEHAAVLPAFSPQGDRLSYVLSRRNTNILELELSPSQAVNVAEAKPVDPSNRIEVDPAFSPDGRRVAFMSDRSGSQEIWVTDPGSDASVRLTHVGGQTGAPSWSPDASQIAFDHDCQIYVIKADGGTPRKLTQSGENCSPSWSRDGQFIYFGSGRSGEFQIWRTSASTGETPSQPAVQMTQSGGFRAFESADGKYLYYSKGRGKHGLWRRSLPSTPNSKEEPILESLQEWGWFALSARTIYFLELAPSVTPRVQLKSLSLSDGRITEIARLPNPVVSETPAIAASQDGKRVLYVQLGSTDADIMLLDNFR